QFFRIERRRVGRNHAEDRLHEAAHRLHRLAEFVVGFGVNAGGTGNFAMRLAVIVHAPKMVAVRHWGESAVERENLKSVAGRRGVTNSLGRQQRADVGANRKLKAGKTFFRTSRPAENMATLEDEHLLSRF